MPRVSTFSVVARDRVRGDLGVATASRFLAVGAVVPYAVAEVGAIATQSFANTSYGPRMVRALRAGMPLTLVHRGFAETDPEHAHRQYGMVDAAGHALTFTGEACHAWAGGRTGDGYAVQGNLLVGRDVVDAVAETYEATEGPLAERLVAALRAGDAAGGDSRGRQGAALLVVRSGGGYGGHDDRHVDLRVDDDEHPVPRLADLLDLHRLYFGVPDPSEVRAIEGELADRLLGALRAHGRLAPDHDVWDEAAEDALRDLAGVLNLEERMVGRGEVDLRALAHIERTVPG